MTGTGEGRPADVAIIGGGIVGTALAAHLAEQGLRVTLYEVGDSVASGASGRNAGEVCRPPDPILAGLYRESLELYRALEGEPISQDEQFRLGAGPIGVLEVAFDGDLVKRVGDRLAAAQPDMPIEFLDGEALRRAEPWLAEGVSAFRVPTGFPVRPADATRAFAAMALRHGARIEFGVHARPWIVDGLVHGVARGSSRVEAGTVVVAAGPWTPELVDPSGTWRPVRASWGVIVEMNLDPAPLHVIGELRDDRSMLLASPPAASGDLPAPILGVNPAPFPGQGRAAPTGLGGTLAPLEPDPNRVAPLLVEHARRFLPGLDDGQMGRVRVCARPQSVDARPLIGRVPGIEGLVVAAGNGAWGISTGPATARLAADAVMTGVDAAVPAELLASRFGPVR